MIHRNFIKSILLSACIGLIITLKAQPQKATEVIHYWHFNQVSGTFSKALADYSKQVVRPELSYRASYNNVDIPGIMDDFDGTTLNARFMSPEGKGMRARNPSDSMELVIHLPSQGYKDLVLSYATQRSPNGMLNQVFDISINGQDFSPLHDTIAVTGINSYEYVELNLSHLPEANNNPNLWIRIRFNGQNTGGSGNNRFDNFVLTGIALNEAPDLLYYWHFNTLQTPTDIRSVAADYSFDPLFVPTLEYTGFGSRDMDAFDEGSSMNTQMEEPAGTGLRVRNPAFNRYLQCHVPTKDCHQLVLEYAVHRSGNGMLKQILEYTTDGINYTSAGLTPVIVDISESYQVLRFDFSGIEASQNNPQFGFRIGFEGNQTDDNGNNRFDNISLKGINDPNLSNPLIENNVLSSLYPNPASNQVNIVSSKPVERYELFSIQGQRILLGNAQSVDLSNLSHGIYHVVLHYQDGSQTQHKLIKNSN